MTDDSLSRAEDWLEEAIDPSQQDDEQEHQERESDEDSKEEDSDERR